MDFTYIGGSMGSVVGEKFQELLIMQSKKPAGNTKSGGARMMEGALTNANGKNICQVNTVIKNKLPYISLCTDPTTGGTTASFAMLGDIIISEPGALIGFAGPRVKDTTGQDLPDGFKDQFLLDNGFMILSAIEMI